MTQSRAKTPPTDSKNGQQERSFAAGEFIFEEGQVGDFAYVLVSGEAEIVKLSKGEFIKLQDIGKGVLFGELALIDKSVRSASARAVTDIIVREIDETALMAYIKKSPEVAMNMMYRLAGYARVSTKTLEGSMFAESPKEREGEDDKKEGRDDDHHVRLLRWKSDADHVINEFQSSQVEIEKGKLPHAIQYTFLSIILLVISFFVWATVSVIDTTILARGRLSTTVPTISVQATDNSVVEDIKVIIGQHVKEGDLMVTLDATYAKSDLARAESEFDLLLAKIQRLNAEMNREGTESAFTIDNRIQRGIYLDRQKEYSSRVASLDLTIKNHAQRLETILGDIELAKEQLEIQSKLEKAQETLHEREIGSLVSLLSARNTRLSSEREYRELQNSVNNKKSDMEATRAEKRAFISGWFSGIGTELSQVTKERDAAAKELVKLRRRQKNVNILAPANGVIIQMENLFVGAIVSEGMSIMSLVPSDVPLTVELDVDPRDIGNLILGTHVSVKLDAVPYQKHGELVGEISFISEDTVDQSLDGEPGTFYRARATILSNELRDLPENFRLVPGMLLNGDIRAGRRRIITYFIYPIIRTIQTSFSEPGR